MRLFIAININEEFRDALAQAQETLYSSGMKGNYTPAENLHLTLAFIGEYPDPRHVMEALERVEFAPFEIRLQGFGNFGDLWWAGLQKSEALQDLARRIRRELALEEIPYDRKKFSPHFTLVRRARGRRMPGLVLPDLSMRVEFFSLMRSARGRSGMVYTEIAAFDA
ncbi:MAG: RNA 2',3'-cyclic phosphodiesterase [Sarcina sp.]|nr:RNA 2',3'-cyclic phosphodiesterase [Sarcina sp.]